MTTSIYLLLGCPVSVEVGDIPQPFQPPLITSERHTTTTTTRQFGRSDGVESPFSQSTFQSASITPSPPSEAAPKLPTFQPPKQYETSYDSSVKSAAINTELGRTVYTPHSYDSNGKVVNSTTTTTSSYSYTSKATGGKISPFDYPPPPPPELTVPTVPPPPPPLPVTSTVTTTKRLNEGKDEVDFTRKSTGITAARYGTGEEQKRQESYTTESRVSRAVREFERSRSDQVVETTRKETEVTRFQPPKEPRFYPMEGSKIESGVEETTNTLTPETYKPADEIIVEKDTIRTPPGDVSRLSHDSDRGFIPPPPAYNLSDISNNSSPTKDYPDAPKERYFGQETPVRPTSFQPPTDNFVFTTADLTKTTPNKVVKKQTEVTRLSHDTDAGLAPKESIPRATRPAEFEQPRSTRLSHDTDAGLSPKETIPTATKSAEFDQLRSTRHEEEQRALGMMDAALASESSNKSYGQEEFEEFSSHQGRRVRQQFPEDSVSETLKHRTDMGLSPKETIPVALHQQQQQQQPQQQVVEAEKQRSSDTFPAPPSFDVANIRIVGPDQWVIRVDQPCTFQIKPIKPQDLKMLTVSVIGEFNIILTA